MPLPLKRPIVCLLLVSTVALSGCIGLAVTGAALGTAAALDRRTIGAQTEDQAIEVNAVSALREHVKHSGGISVTAYNRRVLLTGQVVDEQAKRDAERVVQKLPNVREVNNELDVSGRVSLGTSAADAGITARVKASLLEDKRVPGTTVKVVTESAVVYLMGILTQSEGRRAAALASRVSGVRRVVTLFDYVSDAEGERLSRPPAQR